MKIFVRFFRQVYEIRTCIHNSCFASELLSCHTVTMAATGLTCSISLKKIFYFLFFSISIVQTFDLGNVQNQPNHSIIHKRFEYKYSFKPPYLAQKDGTVPFWEYGGSK